MRARSWTLAVLSSLLACSGASHPSAGGATADSGRGAGGENTLDSGSPLARTDSGSDVGGPQPTPQPDASSPADGSTPLADSGPGVGLSTKYPGDMGIAKDPAVVWAELFDEGSVSAFTARYDSSTNPAGMTLLTDVPPKSESPASIRLTSSGDGANATDFYKNLSTGYEEWYVRWYAKYDASIAWHHTGVWFGGYDPPLPYPFPHAGLKPVGNDRFLIGMEPIWNVGTAHAQFDFYNYWMNMHSYMAVPSGPTAYFGDTLINENSFNVDETSWTCLEVHAKMNTDPTSAAGGVLEVWQNDGLIQSFTMAGPQGYWIRDKFCTMAADGTQCTQYPAPFATVLDLQWRSTTSLQLNYFWPQNYITTAGVTGNVQYADMIVATQRVGCIQ
jgi:hypothetical protein